MARQCGRDDTENPCNFQWKCEGLNVGGDLVFMYKAFNTFIDARFRCDTRSCEFIFCVRVLFMRV